MVCEIINNSKNIPLLERCLTGSQHLQSLLLALLFTSKIIALIVSYSVNVCILNMGY